MKPAKRIPTSGGQPLTQSPFAALSGAGLPPGPAEASVTSPAPPVAKDRGRLEIRRLTAHRGGKTVTEVRGFAGISAAEQEDLARQIQRSCGVGGTVKDGRIEIHGDRRDEVARVLAAAGFRPVLAGG